MKRLVFLPLLLITLLLGFAPAAAQDTPLLTRWAAEVTPDNVLPEYPRPQMTRDRWLNLNGLWDYAVTTRLIEAPKAYSGQILVPFPVESYLSGVQKRVTGKRLWYRRTFDVPPDWAGERLLLNFGAVDWQTTVWVNGVEVGQHEGGYDAFSLDITDALKAEGAQEIVIAVFDPTEGTQPRGKQVLTPGGIWYTPTTGIWQTVWLEPVPETDISELWISTDINTSTLKVRAALDGAAPSPNATLTAEVLVDGAVVASATGKADDPLMTTIEDAQWWSPDSPYLYDLRLTLKDGDTVIDSVGSYFGMRNIEMKKDDQGVPRVWLNNAVIFQYGLLDQGFWPDGLYTAPTDEALRYDIETTKDLGFNMIRKHVKVEPARWYYWADKIGMLVWQDMPSVGDVLVPPAQGEMQRDAESAANFERELKRMVDTRFNSPSIIMWVLFNEGWGQYDTVRLTEWLQAYDPSRLVDSASGWNDFRVGDVQDMHSYPQPNYPMADYKRASVLGEFGGLGLPVAGHTWLSEDNWGYEQYTDVPTLLEDYTKMLKRVVYAKNERGLVAAVYTQTTDVETEVNGIMTYDREVIKMGADELRAANATLFEEGN